MDFLKSLINPSVRRGPVERRSIESFSEYYGRVSTRTELFMIFIMCTVGLASSVACIHFEYRESKNYLDACYMATAYYNGTDNGLASEYETNYSEFGIKGYAMFWHVCLFSVLNLLFALSPCTVVIGLILSTIYACTASYDFIRGQPFTCPRKYDPRFYAVPGINEPLNLTCQYHIKVAVASWINAGIFAFSMLVYFIFIPLGILVYMKGVKVLDFIRTEWAYRKECVEAWKLQKKYQEERKKESNVGEGDTENEMKNEDNDLDNEKTPKEISIDMSGSQ